MSTIEPSGANQNNDTANGNKDSEVPAKIAIKRSGGPRTERGKGKSSRNAVRHGIFSTVILEGCESKQKYQKILRALIEYFKPKGYAERILVEKLAAILWRQARLVRAESAEILNASEQALIERLFGHGRDREIRETDGGMIADGANSASLERGIELLKELRANVERRGFDSATDPALLFKLYGRAVRRYAPGNSFVTYFYWKYYSEMYVVENGVRKAVIPLEEAKKHAIDQISREICWAEFRQQRLTRHEDRLLELNKTASLFPSEVALERIIRYEAHLSREIDRILQQLERFKRIRTGQATLPPIEVNLSA